MLKKNCQMLVREAYDQVEEVEMEHHGNGGLQDVWHETFSLLSTLSQALVLTGDRIGFELPLWFVPSASPLKQQQKRFECMVDDQRFNVSVSTVATSAFYFIRASTFMIINITV